MPEIEEPESGRQLDLYLDKGPDDETLKMMRAITASPENDPFERELGPKELGVLALKGEEMESVLRSGTHRIREELKRRGEEKLKLVQGCSVYGQVQILTGDGMKSFNRGANGKESFYVGMDVHIDGASVYKPNYEGAVRVFGRTMEREYPGYLVTWDGRYDHPVNLWMPVSAI